MGFGGVGAAAACCVLPLALASIGIGASGLAALGPLHTPFVGDCACGCRRRLVLCLRKRRAYAAGADCLPPATSTLPLLVAATAFVALSATWPLIEAPLVSLFE